MKPVAGRSTAGCGKDRLCDVRRAPRRSLPTGEHSTHPADRRHLELKEHGNKGGAELATRREKDRGEAVDDGGA